MLLEVAFCKQKDKGNKVKFLRVEKRANPGCTVDAIHEGKDTLRNGMVELKCQQVKIF